MKKFYLLLFAGILSVGVYAQSYWKQYSPALFTYNASIPTPDKGLIIVTNAVDSNWTVARLMRLDSSGDIVWSIQMNLLPFMNAGRFVDIIQTNDSNYLAVGQMNSGNMIMGLFIHKFDINGMAIWSKMILPDSCGGSIFGGYESHCVIESKDHGFAISGSTGAAVGNGMFLLKTDSAGNPQWFKTYYDYNNLKFWYRNLCQDNDSGYVLFNQYNSLNRDAFLIHADQNGNILLSATLNVNNNVTLNALYNIDGKVYLCFENGFIQSNLDTLDFWLPTYVINQLPGYKFKSIENCRNSDLVLSMTANQAFGTLRTDSAGIPIWANAFSLGPIPNDMFEYPDGKLILQGTTPGGNFCADAILLNSTGNSDCFNGPAAVTMDSVLERLHFVPAMETACSLSVYIPLSDWHNTGTAVTLCQENYVHPVASMMMSVFPNPTTGQIQLSGLNMPCTIEVFSMDGKKLVSEEVNDKMVNVDLSGYPKGVYVIRMVNASALSVAKIILQ